ncbi:hypothetical protein BWI93_05185 [Siphonobacter sp. BAB-5385]|nr:hypothetical protein BWI93_05185 [Siphonobacter sp. BAB-5385]
MDSTITKYARKKLAREEAIYRDYQALVSAPGSMKTACVDVIMEKYNYNSRSAIWKICKRVEQRQSNGSVN